MLASAARCVHADGRVEALLPCVLLPGADHPGRDLLAACRASLVVRDVILVEEALEVHHPRRSATPRARVLPALLSADAALGHANCTSSVSHQFSDRLANF